MFSALKTIFIPYENPFVLIKIKPIVNFNNAV